ncbi:Spectrin beta chain, non-erythrocytic 1 [Liparis tanakae]|uniref:Spectrin beta chain, non-erythrocytic 1 n=1 Tax=Liparis tanakae TaxID=230148 RepID=A0A4Z2GM66_9TELE|nr:Spectrin beta chain, non-erythrocytic 1 [Liparis tanakae]
MTSVAGEFDHMEIQQQYTSDGGVNNRWDADDWDNENSSARLFERSRIKALAEAMDTVYPYFYGPVGALAGPWRGLGGALAGPRR